MNSHLEPIKLYKLEEISPLEILSPLKNSKILSEISPNGQVFKDGANRDFFVENRKKYKIKVPSFAVPQKSPTHRVDDLDIIKSLPKFNFTKKEKNRLGSMSERKLHNTDEVNLLMKK